MFVYGEKFQQRPRVTDVQLRSTNHTWTRTIEDIRNEYIDLTVNPTQVRGKPKRRGPRSDDDITVTISFENGTTDTVTLCDIEFDDSRWLAAQKQKKAEKKKKASSAGRARKKAPAARKSTKKAK